jgi:hypothetical protein
MANLYLQPRRMHCYMGEQSVYLVTRMKNSVRYIYRCDADVLPYEDTRGKLEGRFVRHLELTIDEWTGGPGAVTLPFAVWSPTGLTDSMVKYPSSYSEPITTTFWFHPAVSPNTAQPASARLTFVGELRSFRPFPFFTPSGNYMVYCCDVHDVGDITRKLYLAHFTKDPPAIQVMQLDIPFFIGLDDIDSVAVDDHKGVVFLCHTQGCIFAVPFA